MSFIKSESISNLVAALLLAKAEFQTVVKQSENPGFKRNGKSSKYADLATAIGATEDALTKHGLVVSQFPINEAERIGVLTLVIHSSGEFMGEAFTLPLGQQNAQTGVAAVTYARRTGYLAALGIAAEDDDGQTAAGRVDTPADDEMPDFQDARHAAPRAPAASTAKAEAPKTTRKPEPPAAAPKEQLPPPPPPVPAEKQNQGPAAAPEHGDAYEGPDNPPAEPTTVALPTEAQMTDYRKRYKDLADRLAADGKLSASKGLKINTKLRVFLQQIEKVNSPNELTVEQWTDFFSRADAVIASEYGLVGLTKLINKANGIEPKK